jgi:hypothetical protein
MKNIKVGDYIIHTGPHCSHDVRKVIMVAGEWVRLAVETGGSYAFYTSGLRKVTKEDNPEYFL